MAPAPIETDELSELQKIGRIWSPNMELEEACNISWLLQKLLVAELFV